MDELFAPWRIEWVTRSDRSSRGTCPFCTLPDDGHDPDALIVARGEHSYVLLNNAPYNPGHAMVIPYRHVESLGELTDDERLEQARLTERTVAAMGTAMNPDGWNTGCNLGQAGGGSIDHLHRHVVPRWQGDTNFMAVLDETKVIVQALADTYDALHEAFEGQETSIGVADTGAVRLDT